MKIKTIMQILNQYCPKLNATQLLILAEIADTPGQSQTYYANIGGVNRAALTSAMPSLSLKYGLVTVSYGTENRSNALYLSPKGKELMEKLNETIKGQ